MSIAKYGTPEKIDIKKVEGTQFDRFYDSICAENNLVKCPHCGKLISKMSLDKNKTLQHRGMKAVVEGDITIKCYQCGEVIKF